MSKQTTCNIVRIDAANRVRCSRKPNHSGQCNFRTVTLTRTQSALLADMVRADPSRKKVFLPAKGKARTYQALEKLGLLKGSMSIQARVGGARLVRVYCVTAKGAKLAT